MNKKVRFCVENILDSSTFVEHLGYREDLSGPMAYYFIRGDLVIPGSPVSFALVMIAFNVEPEKTLASFHSIECLLIFFWSSAIHQIFSNLIELQSHSDIDKIRNDNDRYSSTQVDIFIHPHQGNNQAYDEC